jgi:hypothetical protein
MTKQIFFVFSFYFLWADGWAEGEGAEVWVQLSLEAKNKS